MSRAAHPLTGQRVLVTRPAHQAEALCQQLHSLGADVARFPTLAIAPTPTDAPGYAALKARFLDLDHYRRVIFVSANAARLAHDWIDRYWPQLPVRIDWLAVGDATARTLETLGIPARSAEGAMDSEALLALPALQRPDGERILICRGEGGRETLGETLRARGAQVDYAELYRRIRPPYEDRDVESIIYKKLPSAMLVTSAEALSNLVDLCRGRQHPFPWQRLCAITLVVPSRRVAEQAAALGFSHVRVAANATDGAMIATLAGPDSKD